jgi:signal transduction histidine kinase
MHYINAERENVTNVDLRYEESDRLGKLNREDGLSPPIRKVGSEVAGNNREIGVLRRPLRKSLPAVLTLEELRAALARARHSAVLAERNRLAGEIHDGLSQIFTAIYMQLNVAKENLSAKEGDPLSCIQRAAELARVGSAEARHCAHNLRLSVVDKSELTVALRRLVERSSVPGKVRCALRSDTIPENSLSARVQHELLRIAQEAIHNAVRHANPTLIAVTLRWAPPDIVLEVTDDGSGISAAQLEQSESFGLDNMRKRASKIDGRFEIQSAPGHGTALILTVPVLPREHEGVRQNPYLR